MVIFTVLITLIPGMVLRLPSVEYDLPHLDRVAEDGSEAWEDRGD